MIYCGVLLHNDLVGCKYIICYYYDTSLPHNAMHSSSLHHCFGVCVLQHQWTPLHRAAAGNNVNCIKILCDAGGTVLLDDKDEVS